MADFIQTTAELVYAEIGRHLAANSYLTEEHLKEITGCYLEHGGKALRPYLLTLCCKAAGGTEAEALYAAAAVEMFHTWTLMDDDVIDHDDFRRGRPAAHHRGRMLAGKDLPDAIPDQKQEYGVDLAILGAAALQAAANAELCMATPDNPTLTLSLLHRMNGKLAQELLSGEQLDVRLSLTPWLDINADQIREMMRLKTSALLSYSAEAGAIIGAKKLFELNPIAQALGRFASLCGLSFQITDDLLGIFGDVKEFGKPIGSDIREEKRTLIMLTGLQKVSTIQKNQLFALLGKIQLDEKELETIRTILEECGAKAAVENEAKTNISQALEILETLDLPTTEKELLQNFAQLMIKRLK